MAIITIPGAGRMGSAITIPLADRGYTIRLVGTYLDDEIIEEIHQSRLHPGLKVRLSDSVIPYSIAGLAEVLSATDLIVLGVSSPGVAWAGRVLVPQLKEAKPGTPILMLTKGLGVNR